MLVCLITSRRMNSDKSCVAFMYDYLGQCSYYVGVVLYSDKDCNLRKDPLKSLNFIVEILCKPSRAQLELDLSEVKRD